MIKSCLLGAILFLLSSCAFMPKAPEKSTRSYQMRWSKNFSPYYLSGNLPYNRKSPLIHDGFIFTGEGKGVFSARSLENGRSIWTVTEKSDVVSTAVIANEKVIYFLNSSDMVARDYKSGKELYRTQLSSTVNAKPVVSKHRIFLPLEGYGIIALDHRNGELLWAYQRPLAQTSTLQRGSHPIIYRKSLILGFDDGYYISLKLEDGTLLWKKRIEKKGQFLDLDLAALYAHRKLYLGGGNSGVYIADPVSGLIGKRIDTVISSSPISLESGVLLGRADGYVEKISANGEFLRRVKLSRNGISSLNKWGNDQVIAVTYDGELFTLNSKTLEPIKQFSMGVDSTIAEDIAINGDWAAVYTTNYRLYVLKKK